jgi:hypothetical protein
MEFVAGTGAVCAGVNWDAGDFVADGLVVITGAGAVFSGIGVAGLIRFFGVGAGFAGAGLTGAAVCGADWNGNESAGTVLAGAEIPAGNLAGIWGSDDGCAGVVCAGADCAEGKFTGSFNAQPSVGSSKNIVYKEAEVSLDVILNNISCQHVSIFKIGSSYAGIVAGTINCPMTCNAMRYYSSLYC